MKFNLSLDAAYSVNIQSAFLRKRRKNLIEKATILELVFELLLKN